MKEEWRLVKLKFGRSPAHFGEVGIGMEETGTQVASDTLFSAVMTAYARLYGGNDIAELLGQFPSEKSPQHQPPFRFSSTFIYRQTGDRDIYYLPRPQKFPVNYPYEDVQFFKTYKKLSYLPLEVWQKWYQREGFTEADKEELIRETEKPESSVWLREQGTFDYQKAFQTGLQPKVAVDRITAATNFYHIKLVQFQWEQNGQEITSLSGLYFLLCFPERNKELESKLEAAFHLLGEEGLGGDRSSGLGRFEVEWLSLPEPWQKIVNFTQTTHQCLISLFWDIDLPDNFLAESSYEIKPRGGWLSGQQLRRQMVRMFAEGSVLREVPPGKLADVTPTEYKPHPIYRSGISLSLPIRLS
ncbi:MAG TPA: type III-A CRISPR-associated RAMP protein Csm4 [Oscillatoriaceae cyanobacterium M33_DOE_052]|uniref:CRISPR system Cms protein Csm4 n=1 Tax=Planktothricoides sp. SpSt-374 TaxID=2282167 RepID=A0A7C3ZHX7_9CYAN|nr:type III-A CRISPR-associated RAMP protein Csm4 [Oscillatoriaceae cyanobacterium M33_DOE_052]